MEDGSVIVVYRNNQNNPDTYHIALRIFSGWYGHPHNDRKPGSYVPNYSGKVNVSFSGGTLHLDNENTGSISATAYTTSTSTQSASPLDRVTITNSPRYTTAPSISFSGASTEEAAQATVYLGKGYVFTDLEETVLDADKGGNTIRIDNSGRIFITKRLYAVHQDLGYSTIYNIIKEYNLDTTNPTQPTLSLVNSFKIYGGEAPGQLDNIYQWDLFSDDRMVFYNDNYLNFFTKTGEFIKRVSVSYVDKLLINDDQIITLGYYGRQIYFRNKTGDFLQKLSLYIEGEYRGIWYLDAWPTQDLIIGHRTSQNGNYTMELLRRAYRTKGLPTPNVIPQPVVRSIAQRQGTNILDIGEVIDPDDDNATVGILATVAEESQNQYWDEWSTFNSPEFNDLSKLIVPSSLLMVLIP